MAIISKAPGRYDPTARKPRSAGPACGGSFRESGQSAELAEQPESGVRRKSPYEASRTDDGRQAVLGVLCDLDHGFPA